MNLVPIAAGKTTSMQKNFTKAQFIPLFYRQGQDEYCIN